MSTQTTHLLQERVKELTLLHSTARLFQDHTKPTEQLLLRLTELIPGGWQYPEIAGARIRCGGLESQTPNFEMTRWMQSTTFELGGSRVGSIEVCYVEERPDAAHGPFLAEEQELLQSLGEMVRLHIAHRESDEALRAAREQLERQVALRTRQLGQLALELSLTESRERREIASDLHDHVGQALAFVKIKVSQFHGNAVFCGFENTLAEIIRLLDQIIAYTRNLTVQISPPVLYEFGLIAAIEWLAEAFEKEHRIPVSVSGDRGSVRLSPEISAQIFKSVKELLTNSAKHSDCSRMEIEFQVIDGHFRIAVSDNGKGCDARLVFETAARSGRYGLFSIRERMRALGGDLTVSSGPHAGTTVELCIPSSLP